MNPEKSFSEEDLRLAFEAGQNQKSAEWENDTTSCIGSYNPNAEIDFETWFNKHFKNNEL